MLSLEDLTYGMTLNGIIPGGPVIVLGVKWLGSASVELRYQDATSASGVRMLTRADESSLEAANSPAASLLSGDAEGFRLAAEALRFRLAPLFDPFLALRTSRLKVLPHQLLLVYKDLLTRQPIRFLLSDGPGTGKKVSSSLLIKALLIRGDLQRCLVLSPGSFTEAWHEELLGRFELPFEVLTNEALESPRALKTLSETSLAIARTELLARDIDLKMRLDRPEWGWDLVIIDRAHEVAAAFSAGEWTETNRFKLCRYLSAKSRHLLLLTTTPHNGGEQDFQTLMSLLDPDRFEGPYRQGVHATGAPDMGRRLGRDQLLDRDLKPVPRERHHHECVYALSELEEKLAASVLQYARTTLDISEKIDPGHKRAVQLAVATLLQRMTSSPEAVFQALYHRRKRIEALLERAESVAKKALVESFLTETTPALTTDEDADLESLPPGEREPMEEKALNLATPARTLSGLRKEIAQLKDVEALAKELFKSGTDSKWTALSLVLDYENLLFDEIGGRRKLLVLTGHKDSLDYAASRISQILKQPGSIATLHSGHNGEARKKILTRFCSDPAATVLVATDGTLEGAGFLPCHLLINWDLPWSGLRLERRLLMLEKTTQNRPVHVWTPTTLGTAEGTFFKSLFEEAEGILKGPAALDTLGFVFREQRIDRILLQAVCSKATEPALRKIVTELLQKEKGRRVLEALALPKGTIEPREVDAIYEEFSRAEVESMSPRATGAFFREAFEHIGGSLEEKQPGRFEISPLSALMPGRGILPLKEQYGCIAFDPNLTQAPGQPEASLVLPGHPLLRFVSAFLIERYRDTLKTGAILVDPSDTEGGMRVLYLLEQALLDDRRTETGARFVVARSAALVEAGHYGSVQESPVHSFLSLRPAVESEKALMERILLEPWLWDDTESKAISFVLGTHGTNLLAEWRAIKEISVTRTREAVKNRLLKEISFWDRKATELKGRELDGKTPATKPAHMAKRAEILKTRLQKRITEFDQELVMTLPPPVPLCHCIIVPAGLINRVREALKGVH